MSQLSEPELTRKERWIRDYILKVIPQKYPNDIDLNDDNIRVAESILAKEYLKHTNLGVLWKTGVMLLIYDLLFFLPSQVYGLILGALGSLALALTNLYTPQVLVKETVNKPDTVMAEMKSRAELSVKTNVGVSGLVIGFIWQVFSINGPIPGELFHQNLLQGSIQNWLGFAIILMLGGILLGNGLSKILSILEIE